MTRNARIASAKTSNWVQRYPGKNLVRGYCKTFGVDLLCAIRELRILKVPISLEYEIQVRRTIELQALHAKHRRERKIAIQLEQGNHLDPDCGVGYDLVFGESPANW